MVDAMSGSHSESLPNLSLVQPLEVVDPELDNQFTHMSDLELIRQSMDTLSEASHPRDGNRHTVQDEARGAKDTYNALISTLLGHDKVPKNSQSSEYLTREFLDFGHAIRKRIEQQLLSPPE
jgi:hypothetical protein